VNLTDNDNGTYMLSGISQDVTILTNYSYGGLSSLTQDEQNRYLVTSVADLKTVSSVVSALNGCEDMTFLLANDIEFGEDDEFGGIAVNGDYDHAFAGTFDGGGHSIIGMKIGGKAKNLGFIGYLTGTLQNLTLEYCTVKNTSDADDTYAGMLVGYCSSGYLAHCRVFGGEVSGANAGAIYGDAYPYPIAEDNLYDVYVTVVSGGETKAPGTCGTSSGDLSYAGNNAAVVAWSVSFLESGQLAPAQLVPNGGAAIKPEVSLAPREHFTFYGQWMRANRTEYTFDPVMSSDEITANTTLYPLWIEETKYTVTYDGNGSADNSVSESVYASDVSSYRLPYCFYEAPAGCYFNGWKVGEDIYNPDASITLSKDIIVKAQWGHYAFELENDADNADVLESWNTKVADVTLADRTLYKDGNWNTLCLPFDVTIADSPLAGDGVDVRTLSGASLDDGTLTLTFTEAGAVETLSAGVPYIIRWTGVDAAAYQANPSQYDLDASALTFPLRAIDETLNDQFFTLDETEGAEKRIAFRGTYAPITYDSENRSILFVGGNNTLYWPKPAHSDPNDENSPMVYPTIGAQRAYFELDGLKAGDTDDPEPEGGHIRAFRLNFGEDDEAQGIRSLTPDPSPKGEGSIYTLNGVKLGKMPTRKGVYIRNGRKVVVK
jgi:hypothetical protein